MILDYPSLYKEQVVMGLVSGVNYIYKFGGNLDVDTTTTPEDVWYGGGVYTGFPDTVDEVEVFSSSAADDLGSTGAEIIRLSVLRTPTSTAYEDIDVTMNGTSAVNIEPGSTFWRIPRGRVIQSGSGKVNAGTITTRQVNTTSNVYTQMPLQYGQTIIANWSVPYNNVFFITAIDAYVSSATGSGTNAVISLDVKKWDEDTWNAKKLYSLTSSAEDNLTIPLRIEGGADVRMRVRTVGANNTTVTGGFGGFYCSREHLRSLGSKNTP